MAAVTSLADVRYESQELNIDELRSNTLNPRQKFDEAALDELADDIREHGMLEPILARPTDQSGVYEIVAGERRYRAAQKLGLRTVPVRIAGRALEDAESLTLAISENLRRADLDPIERANAFARLSEISGMNQTEIGDMVGKSQPVVSNTIRLLKLPPAVQQHIRSGELSADHGVQIVRFEAWPAIAEMIAALAIERKVSKTDLAVPLPFARDLVKAGLVFEVGPDLPYAKALTTDRGAYIKAGTGSAYGYYLNPEKFQSIKAGWEEAEKQRQATLREAAAGKAGVTATPTRKASNPRQRLPMLDDLAPGTFERITDDSAPAGCSEECPCRGRALLSDGTTETAICIDLRRYRKLARATAKGEERQLVQQREALETWITAHVAGLSNIAGPEVAAMFGRSLMWYDGAVTKALVQLGIELPDVPVQSDEFLTWLSGLGVFKVLQLAFTVALRNEINGDNREMPVTRWYLRAVGGVLPEPETPAEEAEPDAPESDEEAALLAEAHEAMAEAEGAAEGPETAAESTSDGWPPVDVTETEPVGATS